MDNRDGLSRQAWYSEGEGISAFQYGQHGGLKKFAYCLTDALRDRV
jgi:hypothetical protein